MPEMPLAEFEAMLARTFGEDWRSKAIVGPLGVFPLRDLPGEAGYVSVPAPASSASGLWQTMPPARWNQREGRKGR